jgi:hypothetical protein
VAEFVSGSCAHALHAARDHQVFPAGAHLLRGHVHGFQARGAEAIELHAGAAVIPAGLERRDLGDHRALFADGRDHAHDDVVHLARVEIVAALQLAQHAGQQVDGLDFVQAAVFLALAARGADGVVDEGFAHGGSPGWSLPLLREKAGEGVRVKYIHFTKQALCEKAGQQRSATHA